MDFALALDRADATMEREMTTYLVDAARNGDLKATTFWLERRVPEYRHQSKNELSGPDGGAIEIHATPSAAAALVRQAFGAHGATTIENE